MTKWLGVSMIGAILSVGCATSSAPPSEKPSSERPKSVAVEASSGANAQAKNDSAPEHKPIDVTPFSRYKDAWEHSGAEGKSFSDAYTRLVINSEVGKADGDKTGSLDDELQYDGRNWVIRALWGKEFSINLTAKVTVGAYETTVPLASIGHNSNSDGESWSRVVHHRRSSFPLFLVRNDGSASVPSVKFSVNGSKTYTSRGAAAAMQVMLGVAKATGQPLSVVTRLSEQSAKDKSRAIDDAVSRLFSSGVVEEHWSDRDLRYWRATSGGMSGVSVGFFIPVSENTWQSERRLVGTWSVSFDYPRPSIFADYRICNAEDFPRCKASREAAENAVMKDVNPSSVLSYPILPSAQSSGTIRAILAQKDWYATAQAGLAKKDGRDATALALCQKIANEITDLGLNGFDASLVVWAATQAMAMPVSPDYFAKVPVCRDAILRVRSAKS